MSLEREVRNGIIATNLLESLEERFDQIETNLHQKWEDSKADDMDGREQAWMMLKAVKELKRSYLTDIDTGKLAQKSLDEVKKNG